MITAIAPWGGEVTMTPDLAAQFEVGVVYWLESIEPDLTRPTFRRRARVISRQVLDSGDVVVGFTRVPDPPHWSQETDPESRQLAGLN